MRLLAVADWDEVNAKARLGFRGWGLEMPRHETQPAMHRALNLEDPQTVPNLG